MPKVLLSSVFKPFGEDSLYSRKDSNLDCFHSRITRFQGCFSPRITYQTFGLHAIANNIDVPTVVLDFPTLKRFRREVARGYDYVGIGSVACNFQKVRRMVGEVRAISPSSKIVIGGFCSTIPNIKQLLGVDYVCAGEGISFMRELMGLDPRFKFRHPDIFSRLTQVFGVPVLWKEYRLHIIVGLGCKYGCDFCSPSHFYGRKHIEIMETGEEIYREMVRLSDKYGSNTFSLIGDDNFLLDENRARQLRDITLKKGRQFNIFIFASADLVSKWDPAELAEMGINAIWIGRESKFDTYRKNENVALKALVGELKRYGIKVTLSSILLMDSHTKENVWEDLEDHFSCAPTFSQFAFLGPVHGTPLWDRMSEEGRIAPGLAYEEMYAMKRPWFIHPHFSFDEAEKLQNAAYIENFHRLGPGVVRVIDVDFTGYMNMKNSPSKHLRERAEMTARYLPRYRAILLASEHLVPKPEMRPPIRELRRRIEAECGRITAFERIQAAGLVAFGKKQDLVYKYLGDNIQPETERFVYNRG